MHEQQPQGGGVYPFLFYCMFFLLIKTGTQELSEMSNAEIIAMTDLEDQGILVDMNILNKIGDYSCICLN